LTDIRIVDADEVDASRLAVFLDEAFSPQFRGFLSQHSDWWHRGPGHRWAALCDETVAGYRAFTPAVILFDGKELQAAWAFDLFVLPRFRGLGLQKLLDERLMQVSDLVMSFPSDVGAKVYSKQGSDLRTDTGIYQVELAPRPLLEVAPNAPGLLRYVAGRARRLGVRGTARQALVRARAVGLRTQSASFRPTRTTRIDTLDAQMLEDLFLQHVDRSVATTVRNVEFLRWRYLDAPYRSDLAFFITSSAGERSTCAVVRYLPSARAARILDIFGDLGDEEALSDLVRTIVRDAVYREVDRVIVVGSSPALVRVLLRKAGFSLLLVRPFRWRARDPLVHERFSTIPLQWALADSCLDQRQ